MTLPNSIATTSVYDVVVVVVVIVVVVSVTDCSISSGIVVGFTVGNMIFPLYVEPDTIVESPKSTIASVISLSSMSASTFNALQISVVFLSLSCFSICE